MHIIHPDDLKRVIKSIEKSRVELCDWHEVYRVNHPTKGVIWVEGKSSPIARALIGKSVGDTLTIPIPKGKIEVEILEIEFIV